MSTIKPLVSYLPKLINSSNVFTFKWHIDLLDSYLNEDYKDIILDSMVNVVVGVLFV